jgi:hypothetical protein
MVNVLCPYGKGDTSVIMISSYNERTEIAPFQILFGNSVDLKRGILTPFEEILPKPLSLTKTSSELLSLQQQYITIAKDILQKSDEEHVSKNSAQITEFAPSTFMLVQQHTTVPVTLIHTLWRGPMKVIKSIRGQYTLLDLTNLKEKEYHSMQFKEFIFNPSRVSPLDVARKDYLELFIETILHHTGNTTRLSTLNFKVKWCSLTVPVHTVHTCTCACWFQTRFQVPCLVVVS